jgi:hypothetical protein
LLATEVSLSKWTIGCCKRINATAHFHSDGRCHGLDGSELSHSGRIEGISKNSRSLHARLDLLEQFQQFGVQTVFGQHKAGDVAARLGKAIDEAGADHYARAILSESVSGVEQGVR